MVKAEKEPLTVSFKNTLIQFVIVVFFTIALLNILVFNLGIFNIGYFLFMFASIVIASLIALYCETNPKSSIPKKPAEQISNFLKAMTDIVVSLIDKTHPQVQEVKDIVQKAIIWNLREAKINLDTFDKGVLEEAEQYIFDKLFPKKEGEEV